MRHRGLEHVHRLVEHDILLNQGSLAAVQIRAVAEDDAGRAVIDVEPRIAGIGQRVARDTKRQELVGFAAVDRVRHDAELRRIKAVEIPQETAVLRLDAAVVQIALRAPRCAWLADGINTVEYVVPE